MKIWAATPGKTRSPSATASRKGTALEEARTWGYYSQFIGTTWAGGGGFIAKTFLTKPAGCCWPAELEQSNILWWGISQPLALCEETLLGFDLSSARLIWNPFILVLEEKMSFHCLLTSHIVIWDWRGPSFFEYSHSVSLITLALLWTSSSPFSRWDKGENQANSYCSGEDETLDFYCYTMRASILPFPNTCLFISITLSVPRKHSL